MTETTSSDSRTITPLTGTPLTGRLVVVSNRLPVRRVEGPQGGVAWQLSPGGLVRALEPILTRHRGTWVGWAGTNDASHEVPHHADMDLQTVPITAGELAAHNSGFCNSTVWPLYHDRLRAPRFAAAEWRTHHEINRRFAAAALDASRPGDVIWVHDYHLQLAPAFIRDREPDSRIGFFLHIPFPPLELLSQLPWSREVLEGMLGSDVVGFQTRRGAENFVRAALALTDAEPIDDDTALSWRGRRVAVGAFPISLDFARFDSLARDPEVVAHAEHIRADLGHRKLVLGVDRIDYTKGIDNRLEAIEALMARDPAFAHDVVVVQVAVPSRQGIGEFRQLRRRIEQIVGRINGRFGRPGRVPVHCLCASLPPEQLVAYYLAADVMAVTPMRDGMNLVAKEFVATRTDGTGVLVLSEFAGAAEELPQAIVVNPHDREGMAAAIEQAVQMPAGEAVRRMHAMRRHGRAHDVHRWAGAFLEALSRVTSGRRRQVHDTPARRRSAEGRLRAGSVRTAVQLRGPEGIANRS